MQPHLLPKLFMVIMPINGLCLTIFLLWNAHCHQGITETLKFMTRHGVNC